MFSKPEIAVPISLNVWKDPQGNVVLHHSREDCDVFFGCWTETGEPADYLCKLTFHSASAVRGLRLDDLPYQMQEHKRSCIFEVENSVWLEQVRKQCLDRYPESNWDEAKYRHFFISGHDNYYDIVATDFEEQKIPEAEAGELVKLIREA